MLRTYLFIMVMSSLCIVASSTDPPPTFPTSCQLGIRAYCHDNDIWWCSRRGDPVRKALQCDGHGCRSVGPFNIGCCNAVGAHDDPDIGDLADNRIRATVFQPPGPESLMSSSISIADSRISMDEQVKIKDSIAEVMLWIASI